MCGEWDVDGDKKLMALGITTAHDLAHANSEFIRKHFNVVLTRIVRELNGISCLELDAPSNKKALYPLNHFQKHYMIMIQSRML